MDQVAKTYAECKSYKDSGKVTTVYKSADGNRSEVKPFTTAFSRPDRFRFSFHVQGDSQSRYVVWQNGNEVRTWWDVTSQNERPSSLSMGLAGATGVSSGSAHTIPTLLLPREVSGRKITDVTGMKRIDDAEINGSSCSRIEGKFAGSPITIWIDKKTSLIRRIDQTTKFDDFMTEETTLYDPVIDEKLDNKLLEFDAPDGQ